MRNANGSAIDFAWRGWVSGLMGALLLSGLVGCNGNDEIVKTTEPRTRYAKPIEAPIHGPKNAPKVETSAPRILGLIAKKDDKQSWFFKITGPGDDIAKLEAAFDAFVQSLEFDDKKDKPTWTLPEGWRELPPDNQFSIATISTGAAKGPLKMTVSAASGELLANINRWRGQIGLEPIKADQLDTCTTEVKTKQGVKAIRVDLKPSEPVKEKE